MTLSSTATTDSPLAAGPPARLGWQALPAEYAIPERPPSMAEAQQYCRGLARSHYENFSVATWFLPKRLRQHFYNVYAYCRISDDLGDEVGDPNLSLQLLDQWGRELDACYSGQARHPVFVALSETIGLFDIPRKPFADLLNAFRQDQTITRYPRFDDVVEYASIPQIRSVTSCCISVAIVMQNGNRSPTTHAPRCSWPTSGRT